MLILPRVLAVITGKWLYPSGKWACKKDRAECLHSRLSIAHFGDIG
jgi:hypothetical protein